MEEIWKERPADVLVTEFFVRTISQRTTLCVSGKGQGDHYYRTQGVNSIIVNEGGLFSGCFN